MEKEIKTVKAPEKSYYNVAIALVSSTFIIGKLVEKNDEGGIVKLAKPKVLVQMNHKGQLGVGLLDLVGSPETVTLRTDAVYTPTDEVLVKEYVSAVTGITLHQSIPKQRPM